MIHPGPWLNTTSQYQTRGQQSAMEPPMPRLITRTPTSSPKRLDTCRWLAAAQDRLDGHQWLAAESTN